MGNSPKPALFMQGGRGRRCSSSYHLPVQGGPSPCRTPAECSTRVNAKLNGYRLSCLKILTETGAEIGTLEREVDRGFQHARLVAGIVAFAFESVAEDLFAIEQTLDAVGQLQSRRRPL